MKVLVAYDGTTQSKEALRYGIEKVREKGGEVLALHVFNSNMFIDYDVSPNAVEAARNESARFAEDAKALIKETGHGVKTNIFWGEGDPEEITIKFAKDENVDLLLCPPRYKSIIKRFKKILNEQGKESRVDTILDETEKVKMAVVSLQ